MEQLNSQARLRSNRSAPFSTPQAFLSIWKALLTHIKTVVSPINRTLPRSLRSASRKKILVPPYCPRVSVVVRKSVARPIITQKKIPSYSKTSPTFRTAASKTSPCLTPGRPSSSRPYRARFGLSALLRESRCKKVITGRITCKGLFLI